ncbi:hypothetical protein [Photobacterium piscicola]|uniref:hypothetical protein n=1 Tax=Photobacterium piscicola TaxID=1378299 RepID=UPI0038D1A935
MEELPQKNTIGKVDINFDCIDNVNIYSMTKISDQDILDAGESGLFLSRDFLKFGNKAIVISNESIEKFEIILKSAIDKNKNIYPVKKGDLIANKVEYVDRDTYHGEIGIYKKFSDYKWQYEWRLAFMQKSNEGPFILKLGSLRELVDVFDTSELIDTAIKLAEI